MSPQMNANKRKCKMLLWFYSIINNVYGPESGCGLNTVYDLRLFAFISGLSIVFDFESGKSTGVEF